MYLKSLRSWLFVPFICCTVIHIQGCKRTSSASERSVAVKLLTIQPKPLQTIIAVFGQTEALSQAMLSFQVGGAIQKVNVNEGDPVRKGQLLASLDKESIKLSVRLSRARYYEAAASYRKIRKGYRKEVVKQRYAVYLQARANYKRARSTYLANKPLRTSGAISKEQFAGYVSQYRAAKASMEQAWQNYRLHKQGYQKEDIQTAGSKTSQARTQLAQAKKQLKDAELHAPFSGVIATKKIEKGELVAAGNPAFMLMDLSKIKIRVGVPERVIDDLRHGQKAHVMMQEGRGVGTGRLERKGVVIDKSTLTYPVEVIVDNPIVRYENKKPIRKILPGKIVVIIFPRQNAKVGISVPLPVVLNDGKEKFVYVSNKGVAKRVPVQTGKTFRNELVILSGLKKGDKVVISGQHQLSEGRRLYIAGETK